MFDFQFIEFKKFCEIHLALKLFFAGHLFTQVLEKNDLFFFINPPLVVVAVDDFFVFVVVVFFLIFATPYRSLIHLFQRVCTKFYALFGEVLTYNLLRKMCEIK